MPTEAFDATGQRFVLGARLGRGGEGEVFEVVGRPEVVAKVLHPAGRTRAKLEKIQAMLAHAPAGANALVEGLPVLTWPRAVLHSRPTGQGPTTFMGYAMARIRPNDFVPFSQLTSATRRAAIGGTLTWDRLLGLAARLTHVVRTLHRFGYAVGDLNDRNVLVSRRLTPLLMDTDSFEVPRPGGGHFPSIVGDQQYWAPELLDVDLATHKGSRVQGDRHALAVLLFQLLMAGWRPYQATGSAVQGLETLAEKTKAGLYPWARPKRGVLETPASAPRYDALPAGIRHAFERCFVDGHRKPGRRPTADDWHAALARVRDEGFQTCLRETRHVFSARQRSCPWCADPNDPFTARAKRASPSRIATRAVPPPTRRPVSPGRSLGTGGPARTARAPRKTPPQRPLPRPNPAPALVTASRQQPPAPAKAKPTPKPKPKARPARPKPTRGRKRRRGPLRRLRRNAAWVAYTLLAVGTGALAYASA